MKIKRTLPSYTTYIDTNLHRASQQQIQQKFIQRKNNQWRDSINEGARTSKRSSPRKLIFPAQRNSSPQKISNSLKKTVTFAHLSHAPSTTKKDNQNENNQVTTNSRIRKRKIFSINQKNQKDKSFRTQQKSQVINVKLNIKQLSQKLKSQDLPEHKQKQDSNILRKIMNLQTIVKDIQSKVNSNQKPKQNSDMKNSQQLIEVDKFREQYEVRKYYDEKQQKRQNKLLKLQLEQMRRCEKIAKQNQLLYGKLAKNIQSHQNSLNHSLNQSRKKTTSSVYNSSYGGYKNFFNSKSKQKQKLIIDNSQSKRNKIIAFQDFDHFESSQLNKNSYGQQNNDLQITSPFLIEQNRKNNTIR